MSLRYWLLWRKLRSKLGEALDLERERIGPEQAAIVLDYLDHNEFGLAHAQLSDALSDREREPLQPTRSILDETAKLMGLRS